MRVDALLGAERVCIGDDPDGFPCSFGALVYFSWHRVLLSTTHRRSLSINPVSEARSMNAQSQRCKVIMLDPESGGELQSWIVELPAKLGRGIFADISIDHPSISRRHCEFFNDADGQISVRDLGSKNGVYVNGTKLDQGPVESNARVRIGLVQLKLTATDEPADGQSASSGKGLASGQNAGDETKAVNLYPGQSGSSQGS